jgi:hypothetical protein
LKAAELEALWVEAKRRLGGEHDGTASSGPEVKS